MHTIFIESTKGKNRNGSLHMTKDGWVVVIGRYNKSYVTPAGRKVFNYYKVQFEEGTRVDTTGSAISAGVVKNPNKPTIYGVGCIGQGKHLSVISKIHVREYDLWKRMLYRCYCPEFLNDNPTYRGCTVTKRWHNYQLFCEDLVEVKNYSLWYGQYRKNMYHLDKDFLVDGNKIYSKRTCMFLTAEENIRLARAKGARFVDEIKSMATC